MNTEQI